jgi:hypothetical protein
MHITIHLTLKVGSNPLHVTPYFILGWNRWNVWFGMKESSGPPGCILYLSSFSSEYTWVLFNGPNGHWVTPGQPSNTLFKSHNTQAQDLWTRWAKVTKENLPLLQLNQAVPDWIFVSGAFLLRIPCTSPQFVATYYTFRCRTMCSNLI